MNGQNRTARDRIWDEPERTVHDRIQNEPEQTMEVGQITCRL